MERQVTVPRVEDDDTDTDIRPTRLKSIKSFKHTAAQANKSGRRVADLHGSFLQQYSQPLKRKRGQDGGPKKRAGNTFSPVALAGDMELQDTYLDYNNDDSLSNSDSDESSTESFDHRETSANATSSSHTNVFAERHRHVKHWRSWCRRKRYPNDMVTAEKYNAYIKESLAPRNHRDRNNPHLEILPIRIGATDNNEGEIPAWKTVMSYISGVRYLYQEQCESMGLRPDIDGTMATPETVAIVSQFRSSQDMPQSVQAPSYQLKLKVALRYLWMKGYHEQDCAYGNQWCGTRTRFCLAFDRFKSPQHALQRNLLTNLYPAYYMDYSSPRSVFTVAVKRVYTGHTGYDNQYAPTFTRLFRHSDVEICPVGCLAMYLFALWMDEGSSPDFRNNEWQSFPLLQSSDRSKAVSEQTYKRHIGVALGMADSRTAIAARNQRAHITNAGGLSSIHHTSNIIGADTPLTPHSVTDISTQEPYKLTARLHFAREYSVLRDAVVPPLELQRQIFPFIEKLFPISDDWRIWIDNVMMNIAEDTDRSRNWRASCSKKYLSAIRLMLTLAHLRKIILQDVVALKMCARDTLGTHDNNHWIANSPKGPITDEVSSISTAACSSNSAQLPTPKEDEDADTTLVEPQPLEPEPKSQQSMTSCHDNKSQELPQELLGILPTDADDADILEIKKSLASMFRYMEAESKAVGNFASATFVSLDQLQGQMTSVEKTVRTLLEKQDALESRSSEQTKQESDHRVLSFQQEPRILDQWLQHQNELRPWEKSRNQGAGFRRSSIFPNIHQQRAEDSEAQKEGPFNMDALREKMSYSKALNFDVKRRISNLEANLLAVGQSLREVVEVRDAEKGPEIETEAKDEERNDKHRGVSEDDEREESGADEQEKSPTISVAPRKKRSNQYTSWTDPDWKLYPDDLIELVDKIARLYPQHKAVIVTTADDCRGHMAGVVQRERVEAIILES
ncbi:hypothetical protein BGZ96_006805 [Linnemannia gamsii]|uniref:Ndc10 domain-containing protein n=1 Tax=Linnemannia gamsii TaxID=64522 RepID=A0ABQ7K2U3_9FUNG|nr:hypothetical protein BGZ96_006805 [Linnemannia gamsii]